ncbi:MAG: YIP1 family protein [Polyangiaceae bacterium]
MKSPEGRIQSLVEAGKVSTEEGDRLVRALGTGGSGASRFLDPFERHGGGAAAAAGLALVALGTLTSFARVRFDGFLDMHVVHGDVAYRTAIVDGAVAWILPALVFFAAAKVIRAHGRLLDFLGVAGLSRAPLVLAALPLAALVRGIDLGGARGGFAAVVLAVVALAAVAWNLTWLYRGFKNATGARGTKLVVTFAVALVVAETLTKIVLARLV